MCPISFLHLRRMAAYNRKNYSPVVRIREKYCVFIHPVARLPPRMQASLHWPRYCQ